MNRRRRPDRDDVARAVRVSAEAVEDMQRHLLAVRRYEREGLPAARVTAAWQAHARARGRYDRAQAVLAGAFAALPKPGS